MVSYNVSDPPSMALKEAPHSCPLGSPGLPVALFGVRGAMVIAG